MTTSDLPADRRISGRRLQSVLGAWQRPGPAYVALADALRAAILSGSVPLSTRLPSERELADAARRLADHDDGHLRAAARRGLPGEPPRLRHRDHAADGRRHRVGVRASRTTTSRASSTCPWRPRRPRRSCTAPTSPPSTRSPATSPGPGYAPLGLPVLREAIAAWYTRRGTPTTPDQILVTTGAPAGDPPARARARRPGRPRRRRAPHLPARDRRRPRARAPGPCPCRPASTGSTSTCSSRPSGRSPRGWST